MHSSQARRSRHVSRAISALVALLLTICLSGCGATIPADPDGTLAAVSGAALRVGTSADGDLVEVVDDEPSGPIVDLVVGFAAQLHADTEWTVSSEETLVTKLEAGDLDLIAGGITADTPWLDRAGVTRGYRAIEGADGRELVMLVPLGENAFLSALERYLDEEVGG